jgi:hypothetical protein
MGANWFFAARKSLAQDAGKSVAVSSARWSKFIETPFYETLLIDCSRFIFFH